MEIYKRVKVPEVWMYSNTEGTSIHLLIDREYKVVKNSKFLPNLDVDTLNKLAKIGINGSINELGKAIFSFIDSLEKDTPESFS